MDERGHWHEPSATLDRLRSARADLTELRTAELQGKLVPRERPVIEIAIGEMVSIVKATGEQVMATFEGAEKNKVTVVPQDNGQVRPYLELAERVQLQRATGEGVAAQVWDNRNGGIILRTLPVGM